ncbi:MAG: hydrogenase maturation protease [Chthoniobacterales bacterium]
MRPTILVAGIGNIFLGDDAFGVEAVQRLARRELPAQVRVVDFGIRGFDLAYALMDDYDAVILVDAVPRGGAPGTLYTIEPDLNAANEVDAQDAMPETHGMNPMKVLAMVRALGGEPKRILLVGCEPSPLPEDEERMELSEPVEKSLDEAVNIIEALIAKLQGEQHERLLENNADNSSAGSRGDIVARH